MRCVRRGSLALLTLGLLVGLLDPAAARGAPADDAPAEARIEVIQVEGLIDSHVERAIERVVRLAERESAEAVVLQIDSPGGLTEERARRLVDTVIDADVPVVTWIGPPGARARNAAAALVLSGHVRAMAPGVGLGPIENLDMRARDVQPELSAPLVREIMDHYELDAEAVVALFEGPQSAQAAENAGLIDAVGIQLPDLLRSVDGATVEVGGTSRALETAPAEASIRLHKLDLWGRVLHAVARPSIAYMLLLLGLIGVVFEIFHPSTGPSGVTGLVGLGLAGYGIHVLGGSWVAVALLCLGVAGLCVDLRFQSLGVFTALGTVGLAAGSLLLFRGPWLEASPWMLAFGIAGMVLFLLGAMSRVLRDLRAVASGEMEVRDAHEALEEEAIAEEDRRRAQEKTEGGADAP